jgi:hypothetical protein
MRVVIFMLQPCLPPGDNDPPRRSPTTGIRSTEVWDHPELGMISDRSTRYHANDVADWVAKQFGVSADSAQHNSSVTLEETGWVYCPLLKRMLLTFTAWVESLYIREDGREWRGGRTYRSCQKHLFISLHVAIPLFITILKSNLYTPLTKCDTTVNNSSTSYALNMTAFQPNAFFGGKHRLQVIKHASVSFPQRKNCQGQTQTPQSVWVLLPRYPSAAYTKERLHLLTAFKQANNAGRYLRLHSTHQHTTCVTQLIACDCDVQIFPTPTPL